MSMPKGYRSAHGYATSEDGIGFREIANIMTKSGDEMNHSTARNLHLRGMMKIAVPLAKAHFNLTGQELENEARRIANDPRFQEGLNEIIASELRRKNKQ